MAGLERAGRGLRQERRVEHEVLRADDRRAAITEQSRDVAAGEAAADDERSTSSLPRCRHLPTLAATTPPRDGARGTGARARSPSARAHAGTRLPPLRDVRAAAAGR